MAEAPGGDPGPPVPHLFSLPDEAATDRLGRRLSDALRVGSVVGLVGDLGAGKTRLVRAVALAAGVAPAEIGSPTYTLVREYRTAAPADPAADGDRRPPVLFHLDAYRMRDEDEFADLGPEEFWEEGAVLIEWADRLADALPPDRLTLTLSATGETSRALAATAAGPDSRRLLDALRPDATGPGFGEDGGRR